MRPSWFVCSVLAVFWIFRELYVVIKSEEAILCLHLCVHEGLWPCCCFIPLAFAPSLKGPSSRVFHSEAVDGVGARCSTPCSPLARAVLGVPRAAVSLVWGSPGFNVFFGFGIAQEASEAQLRDGVDPEIEILVGNLVLDSTTSVLFNSDDLPFAQTMSSCFSTSSWSSLHSEFSSSGCSSPDSTFSQVGDHVTVFSTLLSCGDPSLPYGGHMGRTEPVSTALLLMDM